MFVYHACIPMHIMWQVFPEFPSTAILVGWDVHLHLRSFETDHMSHAAVCVCKPSHFLWGQNEQKGCALQKPALQLTYDCRARAFFFPCARPTLKGIIDIYWLHWGGHDEVAKSQEGLVRAQERLVTIRIEGPDSLETAVAWVQYSGCIIDDRCMMGTHCFGILGLHHRHHNDFARNRSCNPPSQLTKSVSGKS